MGCTAFLDEVDSVTGGVNVTAAVFNLKLQSERSFFGSGVFETTAVVVAVFVAAYVVVPDPTGTQHAQDLSEYSVYAQWRWAMLILIADLGFTLAVIVHQLIECWRGSDVLWLVLLMFAPWAPVARQVFLTFAAWSRVRTMMRARMVSNTLTAVLREGFYLGYPGLSMGTVGVHFFHMKALPVPSVPSNLLQDQRGRTGTSQDIIPQIEKALARSSGLPLTKSALRRGPQIADTSGVRFWFFKHLSRMDLLALRWSLKPIVPLEDPFSHRWTEQGEEEPSRWTRLLMWPNPQTCAKDVRDPSPVWRPLPIKRVRILDVIDVLQPGGTVSEQRLLVLQTHSVCRRCVMAVRATVETFLESNRRQHSGARVATWFKAVDEVKWYGGVTPCLEMMWECCFADNSGLRVEGDSRTEDSPCRQPVSSTDMTSWFLLFLFLVTRSLLDYAHSLSRVNNTVRSHLKPTPFWNLFWDSMRSKLSRASPMGSMSKVLSDRTVEQLMEDALADTVDKHVGNVVKELCETFIDPSDYPPSKSDCIGLARLCDVDSCILHQPKSLITFTMTSRPPQRRPAPHRPPLPQ